MDDHVLKPYEHAEAHHPGTKVSTLPDCHLEMEADFTLLAFKCSQRVLNRFRESLIKCQACPDFDLCKLHEQRQALLDRSLSELNEEWGW